MKSSSTDGSIMEDYQSGGSRSLFLRRMGIQRPSQCATVRVDGKPTYETGFIHKTTGATNDLGGEFGDFAFGFRPWAGAPQAFDVYYDKIALDTKRIGPVHEDHAEIIAVEKLFFGCTETNQSTRLYKKYK